MKIKTFFVTLVVLASVIPVNRIFAQATVSENEPVTIYVSQSGSDANPGTSAKPYKTIQAAMNKAKAENNAGVGTRILIAPGVYRETIAFGSTKTTAPVTVQAQSNGTVYVDGADILTTWYLGRGVYNFPWKDSVSGCSLPSGWYSGMPPIVLANEMLFVNDMPLTQVMSASQLRAGTFFYNTSYQELEVYPFSGTNMNTAKVEVAARRTTLSITNSTNVVLRGLVFQHAASCMNTTSAAIYSSKNILIDSVQANWNNWGGFGLNNSSEITVQNSVALHNGGVGLAGNYLTSTLWQSNETDYNNWRGSTVGLYDFAQAGVKLMHVHGVTIDGHLAYNNAAQGIWLDTDNTNLKIDNAILVGNSVANMHLEANQGPATVSNSSLCSGGMGLHLINTADLTITGNNFYNNGGNAFQNGQLFLAGNPGGRMVTDWQTGQKTKVYTTDTTVKGNTFAAVGGEQYVFNTYLSGNDWSEYVDHLASNNNNWYNSTNTTAFSIPAGKHENLTGWRSTTAQDYNSSWTLGKIASLGCNIPAPDYYDYQLQAHNAASYVSVYNMSKGTLTIPLQLKSFLYGAVQLSVPGLPSGVTASFSTSTLTSGNPTLTLHASSSAKNETVPVTIFAASKTRIHSLTLMVSIKHA